MKDFQLNEKQLNETQNKQFATYFHELVAYNEKVNLTAITEENEVYIKHFYDSMLGESYISQNATVVDVGTGAGFPGLPLKILRPDINLYLVDSLNKRIEFLKMLITKLNVEAQTFHSRAEEFAVQNREKFDVAVSRAVASLNTLCEYTLPLVKVGGIFIAYKGSNADEELKNAQKAISTFGGVVEKIDDFELPNGFGERKIIVIRKIKNTQNKYPRPKNLPKLKPIV